MTKKPDKSKDPVQRVTISLTKAIRQHPRVKELQKIKRLSSWVEGLMEEDLKRAKAEASA